MKINKKIKCPKCGYITECNGSFGERIVVTCPRCGLQGSFTFPEKEKKDIITDFKYFDIIIPTLIITILIIISNLMFSYNYMGIFISFSLILFIFLIFKFDGRLIIFFGLSIFVFSLTSMILYKNDELIDKLGIYSYGLLFVGVICLFLEYGQAQRLLKIGK